MKPTSVLILITKSVWGGAQRYVYDVATRLPKDRFKVEVLSGQEGPLITRLMEAGISAHGSLAIGRDINLAQDVKAFFQLISLLRDKRPDVLHVNSSKIGGLGALAGRLARVKRIVFTAHGWAFNEERSLLARLFIMFLYWVTMALSHETVAVSHAAKRQVAGWPLVGKKIRVIHNGISRETVFSRSNARLELVRMSPDLKKAVDSVSESNLIWIGTVAELHHIKGYAYALRAIADCIESLKRNNPGKRVIYTIFGAGEERERLQALVSGLGLADSVFFMGHVPGAAEYVSAFDIFLLASLSEGLAYVLLEAGASAVPVVATAVGGIPEVVDDMGSGILVQPKNARELAHALLFMVEHPADRKRYGLALKEKISKQFSVEEMVNKTEEAYLNK